MTQITEAHLAATSILDGEHPKIKAYVREVAPQSATAVEKAIRLFYAVRDGIWYDPYSPFYRPEHYRASEVLARGRGYCVGKAALLCALTRSAGIPSRLGFATVKNHLATRQLIEFLGSDLFVYHGYTELFLNGKWIMATPAFNIELCRRHKVDALEFNGRDHAVFQAYSRENQKFMEYLEYHGTYDDVPVDVILKAWKKTYGENRVRKWIEAFERTGGESMRDFFTEDVLHDESETTGKAGGL